MDEGQVALLMTTPGTDKLGLLGPVLNSQGLLECQYCSYTTDKKANWYKHKKKHSGLFLLNKKKNSNTLCMHAILPCHNVQFSLRIEALPV